MLYEICKILDLFITQSRKAVNLALEIVLNLNCETKQAYGI